MHTHTVFNFYYLFDFLSFSKYFLLINFFYLVFHVIFHWAAYILSRLPADMFPAQFAYECFTPSVIHFTLSLLVTPLHLFKILADNKFKSPHGHADILGTLKMYLIDHHLCCHHRHSNSRWCCGWLQIFGSVQHSLSSKILINVRSFTACFRVPNINPPHLRAWNMELCIWDAQLKLRDKKLHKFLEDANREDNLLYSMRT